MTTLDALRDALVAGGIARVYKLGAVPASPVSPYVVVGSAPAAPQTRFNDGSGDREGRFTVQHFGKSADVLDDLAALTFATFDAKPLPLPGAPVAWQEIATTPHRDPDTQGVLSVLHTYRY